MSSPKRQPNKYFDVVTYTGNGSTQDVRGLNFKPDFVWLKSRSRVGDQGVFDVVRGPGYRVYPNGTSQQDPLLTNALTSFNSDGFSLGDLADVNQSTHDFVAWCWKAGDTTETIAVGSKTGEFYNTSQIWSSGSASGNWSPGVEQLFNGDTSSGASTPASNVATYVFPNPITANTSIKVYAGNGSGAGTIQTSTRIELIVDGQAKVVNGAPGLIDTGLTGVLSGFNLVVGSGSGSADMRYIVIDGNMLVDSNATLPTLPSVETTVSVNREAGFSVSTYTGNGSSANIYHGLGTSPDWIVIKKLTGSGSWIVWHSSFGTASNNDYLYLNDSINAGGQGANPFWNSTPPNSATFSLGGGGSVNDSGDTYIAYCWAAVPGYSATGAFRGNGSTNGKFVNCGFKPRFVLIKGSSIGSNWVMHDTERATNNPNDKNLKANRSDAEIAGTQYEIDIVSTGFKIKTTNTDYNGDNDYIYLAFADESSLTEATQVLDFSDTTNLESLTVGTEVTTASGAESEIINNDGTNIEVLYNASGPFAVGETLSITGQGSGTITSINKINNTITLSNVSEFYSVGQTAAGNTPRHGAMAVSDAATSVLEAPVGYTIPGSVTFNKAADVELRRTPSLWEANRRVWTWSGWVKRANLSQGSLFSTFQNSDDDNYLDIHFNGNAQLNFGGWSTAWRITNSIFTNTSGWTHLVFVLDTPNPVASKRIRMYADGVELTDFLSSADPALNQVLPINQVALHKIGANAYYTDNAADFDGSMAEVHFVSGKALTPSDFGYEVAGWWLPKAYSGDHGANGFYLPFGPEATGVNYSSTCNTGGNTAPNEGVNLMFDGNLITTCQAKDSGGATLYTFTFDPPIGNGVDDVVDIHWYYATGYGNLSALPQVNGSDITPVSNSWTTAGSQVTSVGLIHAAGTDAAGIQGIRLNGEVLIDYSSIGEDASGNGNDWTAVNMISTVLVAKSSPTISAVGQTATFQDDTDLDKFNPDDLLVGGATVVQADAENNQMTISGADWRLNLADSSQVWSNSVVGPTLDGFPETHGFDGDESTYTYADNQILGDSITATFDITGTTFRIKAWCGPGYELIVNGTNIGNANQEWVDVSSIVNGRLTSIVAQSITNSSSAGWSVIEVDGKVLLDAALEDYVWSENVVASNGYASNEGVDKLFDGSSQFCAASSPGTVIFTSPVQQSGILELDVYCGAGFNGSGLAQILLDGSSVYDASLFTQNTGSRVNLGTRTWTELQYGSNDLSNWINIARIIVDGKVLIDSGARATRGLGLDRALRAAVDGDNSVDSPSSAGTDTGLGGEVIGNYATLDAATTKSNFSGTFSEGNLTVDVSSTGGLIDSTFTMYSGKFYFEATFERTGGNGFIGVSSIDRIDYVGSVIYLGGGAIVKDGSGYIVIHESWNEADVVGVGYDADAGLASFYKNGVLQDTISVPKNQRFFTGSYGAPPKYTVNFGAKPFKFPAPAGYLCLCDTNM